MGKLNIYTSQQLNIKIMYKNHTKTPFQCNICIQLYIVQLQKRTWFSLLGIIKLQKLNFTIV